MEQKEWWRNKRVRKALDIGVALISAMNFGFFVWLAISENGFVGIAFLICFVLSFIGVRMQYKLERKCINVELLEEERRQAQMTPEEKIRKVTYRIEDAERIISIHLAQRAQWVEERNRILAETKTQPYRDDRMVPDIRVEYPPEETVSHEMQNADSDLGNEPELKHMKARQ